ncbi:1-acyl-sn-glycerol-3-phosphate acyltransferase [Pilibacter termitis]|uniref:1-acyl-sn-glycerol-3-phosphate acyltransferase n=1 Tax=Pilibacter termitis TaxID=263852 RepID=A0A1T4R8M7_9ENTE|nr:1-acyl-sn-glycerol-3-phosphate acyltransferase [Pilibacter termitis]SKA12374.1 1-acyl-sn-glycerol-3-phosphate acyltransferase [Pilibacter termitis]
MFFAFMRGLVSFLLLVFNGKARITGQEKIPNDENYILVAPHRTFFDPVYMAIGAKPKRFIFMAKEELFQVPVFGWIIKRCGAFPVNREKPGPSAIKFPVKELKNGDASLIMFPSGTRHSTDLKGGVALIAKMAKVKIVPAVYQGPLTLKGIFARKRVSVRFGEPIDISDIPKINEEGMQEVSIRLQQAFDTLDKEINPDYRYVPIPKKKKG